MRLLLTAGLLIALAFAAVACGDDEDEGDGGTASATAVLSETPSATTTDGAEGPPPVTGAPTVTDSGLQIIDITVGDGAEATAGATVTVHYTGWLEDGTVFDSSIGGEPISFALSGLIAGWQEGIPGMKAGGKRRLIIPPELAYGEAGSRGIPGNATLTFDIELLDVQ